MPFKVCSCPKRDMQREGISQNSRKRDSKVLSAGKRPSKMPCLDVAEVKVEPPTPEKNYERPFVDTKHTVTLTMPTKESMKHVLRCAYNEVTGAMMRDETLPRDVYMRYANKIQNLKNSF